MIGAIAGDIIGSRFEGKNSKLWDFELFAEDCRFTDDTVCTVAIADTVINGGDFSTNLRSYARKFDKRGYGKFFRKWAQSDGPAYGSWGNGSAMRVSPVAYCARNENELLDFATQSAIVTHNHIHAIKGAQCLAYATWLAIHKHSQKEIRRLIEKRFEYDFDRTIEGIRPTYRFDSTCEGSVPVALIAVFEATSFEDGIRRAIYVGGDSDTIACMAGSVLEPLFGVPEFIVDQVRKRIPTAFGTVIDQVYSRHASIKSELNLVR